MSGLSMAGAPDDDGGFLFEELLRRMAVAVRGTEAAGFWVRPAGGRPPELILATHLRPGNSDADLRRHAVEAFRHLIGPCVERRRDAVLRVSSDADGLPPQYCLIRLLRSATAVRAVVAVIARYDDMEEARRHLRRMG